MRNKKFSLTDEEAIFLGRKLNQGRRYRLSEDEESRIKEYRGDGVFEQHCEDRGINKNDVSLYWDKTKDFSILVRPEVSKDDLTPEYIREVVSKINFDPVKTVKPNDSEEILRLILTDVHIGMETDSTGYGLYNEVWNEEELFNRLDIILDECARIQRKFKEIHVIDLGDYMDGLNGQTTRGGHSLPQNMSNRKAFKVGVKFKVELYSRLQQLFDTTVVAYNVCNDNHSSDFGYIVNESVKSICELSNPNISVNNLERFMSHYTYGKHCFILCHGKDEKHMKFGLKVKLDPTIQVKILDYIKYYGIKEEFITFEKGDSHQQLFDSTSSEDFEYFNYRAFSPASGWVKHNFKLGSNGFTLMTVRANKKSKGIEAIEF